MASMGLINFEKILFAAKTFIIIFPYIIFRRLLFVLELFLVQVIFGESIVYWLYFTSVLANDIGTNLFSMILS